MGKITISIDNKKAEELKKKADKMGISLSMLMTKAASDVDPYFNFTFKGDKKVDR